jgi:multisubunit Na+/H+ antiporter MnhC subunit
MAASLFLPACFFASLLFIAGFYYILATNNLIRVLIGVELLMKAVTLLLITVGYASGQTALMQSLVITLIVIEVVVIAVATGIVIGIHAHNKTLDTRKLRNLKG